MNIASFVAFRYLRSHQNSRFLSWISILSMLGICIGIATLIIVLSVINGFEKELRERFLAANAHILAYRFPSGMQSPELWMKDLNKNFSEHITGAAPFVHFDTISQKGSLSHSVLVRGIKPKQRQVVQDLSQFIEPSSALQTLQDEVDAFSARQEMPKIPSVILGRGVLRILDIKIGDVIEIISPAEEIDAKDPDQSHIGLLKPYKVIASYNSGLQHYDNKLAILSLPAAQKLFGMGTLVTGLEIGLKKPNDSKYIASMMRDHYTLSIKDWQSYNRNLFEAMEEEKELLVV